MITSTKGIMSVVTGHTELSLCDIDEVVAQFSTSVMSVVKSHDLFAETHWRIIESIYPICDGFKNNCDKTTVVRLEFRIVEKTYIYTVLVGENTAELRGVL